MAEKKSGSVLDPRWYKDAIIYELHVRTFMDGNNDGIGDFQGLIQKLDYLQELGVTCLWLLPFFPSPLRDDGYDIADYTSVHPDYGTLEDFQQFLDASHERDLQVMIELVVNHTSDQHPWFQRARQAPAGSPERNFYVWSDTDKKFPGVRIIFTDTEKSNWTWDPVAQSYYWHRFFSHQPDLNFDNPQVLEQVQQVMAFWLDMGVDGLRLDAIPYIIERDGTNCENLPETHAVVKKIRREMDERYLHRIILAEANQWPTDVRAYFGESDECHMAFHFPLMPRMYMALRMEDRHPITDILEQTPPIPDDCQWGLFLRNHDELTLEMVSDEERDYMYLAYSADPQMRINVGIRRRLSPLMEHNRRRIELLNGILFSFPGTPILYYGDEIGMGDNIYLGDRNGVRTPMQWSEDRNAGFSRATPAKLCSPIIMDSIYGYQSLNVESQQSDPSSLLNWMRRMIALRKLFKVFGRGTLEMLRPSNNKVLAYLRCMDDERVLCVANLSRFAQPVEIDLSSLAGMVPIEMFGYVEFPKFTRAPYFLTLTGYEFLWFELHNEVEPAEVDPSTTNAEQDLSLSASDWREILQPDIRSTLENSVLPRYLQRQRWFAGKSRNLLEARFVNWCWLDDIHAVFSFLEVKYSDGAPELYALPLCWLPSANAEATLKRSPQLGICPLHLGGKSGWLCDGTADEHVCSRLIEWMEREETIPANSGVFLGEKGAALASFLDDLPNLPVHRLALEQSNSTVFFGDKFLIKIYRRLEPGINPDAELSRFLSEGANFSGVPSFGGTIRYQDPSGVIFALGLCQSYVVNQGDCWKATVDELGRYLESAGTRFRQFQVPPTLPDSFLDLAQQELPQEAIEEIGIYHDVAVALGRRTAEMHRALASGSNAPDIAPEPFTSQDRSDLLESLRSNAFAAFALLKKSLVRLPDELLEQASLVFSLRSRILTLLGDPNIVSTECSKIRVHGDFHLGQILRVANDFVILDFEGEPTRSLAERRARQLALKDVAGMLRSFSYAAQQALIIYSTRWPEESKHLEPWTRAWEMIVSGAYLRSYCQHVGAANFLPSDPVQFRRMLELFLLDKALYELQYELNNRPEWVRIPVAGILGLHLDKSAV